MQTKTTIACSLGLAILLLVESGSILANAEDQLIEDSVDMSEAINCISLRGLKKTKILNNQTILFYARGNKVFQNALPRKCPGLNENSVISYTVRMSRLCHHDDITVLQDFGGSLSPGFSCALGKFEQVPSVEALLGLEDN